MELLEEYQVLIERDAAEISWLWKLLPAFFYFTSAVTGYICSIMFYVIWNHIFSDNCPLWANSVLVVPVESRGVDIVDEISRNSTDINWWDFIVTNYDYKYKCRIYFTTCFLSCIFGTMWFTMFLMCGKGGHDVGIFRAPWRIVVPATIFNVIFVLITTYSVTNLEKGYLMFSQNLKSIYIQTNITRESPKLVSQCEIVQKYLQHQDNYEYDLCILFPWLQVLSYIMMWSWLGGLLTLIFRIITINDFKLLKIRIYDVSNDFVLNETNNRNGSEDNNMRNKEKVE